MFARAADRQFVGFDNFTTLFRDPHYLASFKTTAVFSVAVAGLGIAISLLFATMANRVIRGAIGLSSPAGRLTCTPRRPY